ncbi:hypothetical protein HY990_00200 [Candidatus Micrarchaeota archaeon]|nr:hypothetical protein [Candidatus Micrarchaeota archaeon]
MGDTDSITIELLHKRIMQRKPEIIDGVKKAISHAIMENRRLDDYKIVWSQLQDIATVPIEKILTKEFPGALFYKTESKSTYPDLKMAFGGKTIAIDIKSNEAQKEPWYDIARLDTILEERLNKFDEEYDLVVKYDSKTGALIDVYFELMRDTVGVRTDCNGVKFRPYDGKLRPKSWSDFASGKTSWGSKDEFLKGLRRSQVYRWKLNIENILLPILSEKEKTEFRKLFD